jgi:fibro-slime domain-containing protein
VSGGGAVAGGGATSAQGGSTTPIIQIPDGGFPSSPDVELAAETKCDDPIAYIRDFRGCTDSQGTRHPDFENLMRDDRGIVTDTLDPDGKPAYAWGDKASTAGTVQSESTFRQWYRDVSDVNQRFEVTLKLTPDPNDPTAMIYDTTAFFPIDGKGFGNQACQSSTTSRGGGGGGGTGSHNYSFTTEIHTKFTYKGGEKFTFRGDDDVFVYVNNKLVMDLGGVHTPEQGEVDFDAVAGQIGITIGNSYPMDIFHAERHTVQSNFRMQVRNICLTAIKIP